MGKIVFADEFGSKSLTLTQTMYGNPPRSYVSCRSTTNAR